MFGGWLVFISKSWIFKEFIVLEEVRIKLKLRVDRWVGGCEYL